jgi:hypothetical protein
MRNRLAPLVLIGALMVCLAGVRAEARNDDRSDAAASNAAALRELLEGAKGRREAWLSAPSLVIVTSVMDYTSGDLMNGYSATAEQLTKQERDALVADFTQALGDLTGGQIKAFADVRVESAPAGQIVKVLRAGQIVVGRYRGVQNRTGSLGYGGRMTRGSQITAAAVIIDRDADRDQNSRMIRTHEWATRLAQPREITAVHQNPRAAAATDCGREALRAGYLR